MNAYTTTTSVEAMNKDELRPFIQGHIKKLAAASIGKEFPTTAAITDICKSLGYDSVSDITAYAPVSAMREVAIKIMGHPLYSGAEFIPASASAAELPPPPAEIKVESFEGDELEDALAAAEKQMAKLREAAAKRAATSTVPPDLVARLDEVAEEIAKHSGHITDLHKKVSDHGAEVARLKPIIDAITAALPSATPPPPRVVAAVAAATSPTKDRMLEAVRPFFTPGLEQTCAIPAVVSPPSFGKTFMADSIAGLYEASFLHPFKDDIDEISALVGTVTPRPDGTLLTADGPLTAALRTAAAGTKTLFIGDEVFNATRKTMEWMLSTLSPRVYDGKRCYILQTRQVEEDGTFEILRAPVENLHILFMGNLRASPPEAFASRIQLLRFDFSKEWAEEVCLARLEFFSGGLFTASTPAVKTWAAKFALLMEATRARYSTLELARPLCFRFLIAAIQNVCRWESSPTVKHLSEYFHKYLPQQIAVQNAATQDTDPTSFALAKDLAKLMD